MGPLAHIPSWWDGIIRKVSAHISQIWRHIYPDQISNLILETCKLKLAENLHHASMLPAGPHYTILMLFVNKQTPFRAKYLKFWLHLEHLTFFCTPVPIYLSLSVFKLVWLFAAFFLFFLKYQDVLEFILQRITTRQYRTTLQWYQLITWGTQHSQSRPGPTGGALQLGCWAHPQTDTNPLHRKWLCTNI